MSFFNPPPGSNTLGPQTPLFGPTQGQTSQGQALPPNQNALQATPGAIASGLTSAAMPAWVQTLGKNLTNPAFWKSTAIVGVAIILIGSGVILMAFGELNGVQNRRLGPA